MEKYIQIYTTIGKKEEAEHISEKLVSMRLAACVQIVGPIESIYWWNGAVEKSEEWLCVMKTDDTFYKKIEKVLSELHSYEVPEIISLPIIHGSEKYLSWLRSELHT
jgi:periplasmic divalent cation tolerance protein